MDKTAILLDFKGWILYKTNNVEQSSMQNLFSHFVGFGTSEKV